MKKLTIEEKIFGAARRKLPWSSLLDKARVLTLDPLCLKVGQEIDSKHYTPTNTERAQLWLALTGQSLCPHTAMSDLSPKVLDFAEDYDFVCNADPEDFWSIQMALSLLINELNGFKTVLADVNSKNTQIALNNCTKFLGIDLVPNSLTGQYYLQHFNGNRKEREKRELSIDDTNLRIELGVGIGVILPEPNINCIAGTFVPDEVKVQVNQDSCAQLNFYDDISKTNAVKLLNNVFSNSRTYRYLMNLMKEDPSTAARLAKTLGEPHASFIEELRNAKK